MKKNKPIWTEESRRYRLVQFVFLVLPFLFLICGIALLACVLLRVFADEQRMAITFLCAGFVDAAILLVALRSLFVVTVNPNRTVRKFFAVLCFVFFAIVSVFSYVLWQNIFVSSAENPSPLGDLNALFLYSVLAQAVRFLFFLIGLLLSLNRGSDITPQKTHLPVKA